MYYIYLYIFFFFFQAEDGIRDIGVTGVQTCALPISSQVSQLCHGVRPPEQLIAVPATLMCSVVLPCRSTDSVLVPRSEERRVGKECLTQLGACTSINRSNMLTTHLWTRLKTHVELGM